MIRRVFLIELLLLGAVAAPAFGEEGPATHVETHAIRPAPAHVDAVSGEELETEGVTTVEDAVLLSTGAQAMGGLGTGTATKVSIDGLPPGHLDVLQDGVPIARAVGGPEGPGLDLASLPIDAAAIERIEVRRGIGPNGSSGVVVNIITRDSGARVSGTTRVGAHAGGIHQRDVLLSGLAPLGDWSISVEASALDRQGADVDDDGVSDSPDGTTFSGRAGVSWRSGLDSFTLDLRGRNSSTRVVGAAAAPFDDDVETMSFGAAANGEWQFDSGRIRHLTHADLTHHDFDKIVRASGFERSVASTQSWRGGQTAAATIFVGRHDLTISADADGERVGRTGESGAIEDAFIGQLGLSIGDHWYVSRVVELHATARGAGASPWGFAAEGEIGASFQWQSGVFARSSVSQTRRLPTAEELYLFFDHSDVGYAVVGNDELQPELLRSANLELGWNHERVRLSLLGFGHVVENGIVNDALPDSSSTFTYVNRDRLLLAGARGRADTEIASWLDAELEVTYQPLAVDEDGARLPLRPTHQLRFELRSTFFEELLTARTWLHGRAAMAVPEGSPAADAAVELNAGVALRPWPWLRAGIDARNLADVTHPQWGPIPGRHLLATVTVAHQ